MKLGIIGPSKLRNEKIVSKAAKIIAKLGHEVFLNPHKGSVSEFFAQEYLKAGGKKVYSLVPFDDKEFGVSYVNTEIGENINSGRWRDQPIVLNIKSDVLVCLGYAIGGMIEICYSKHRGKKPIYIINETISGKLPKEFEKDLDLRYINLSDLERELKHGKS